MQKWEYLDVWASGASWEDSMGRSGEFPTTKGGRYWSLASLLNELGEQGWELADVVRAMDDRAYRYQKLAFKRPRA